MIVSLLSLNSQAVRQVVAVPQAVAAAAFPLVTTFQKSQRW